MISSVNDVKSGIPRPAPSQNNPPPPKCHCATIIHFNYFCASIIKTVRNVTQFVRELELFSVRPLPIALSFSSLWVDPPN